MLPTISLGPLAVPLPIFILLFGVWATLSIAERQAPRYGLKTQAIYNLALVGLLSGFVGARLAYLLRYPAAFDRNILDLLSRDPGLLDPLGGLAAGLLAALIYGQWRGLPLWPTLDAFTPGLAIFGVALGLSHLASGTAFGAPTDQAWGIRLWGATRHPSQVYETLAALLILWVVWPGRRLLKNLPPGGRFLVFAALTAAARLFLEAFRGDSVLLGGFRQAQVLAWLALAAALYGLWRRRTTFTASKPRTSE